MQESIDIQGIVTLDITDEHGNLIRRIVDNNLVTTAGKAYLIKKIVTDPTIAGTIISDIAFGDGSTTPDVSDTALASEVARVSIGSIADTENVGVFLASLETGVATGLITEAGLYTNEDTPTLVSRIEFSVPFTKQSNEAIQVSWRIKLGSDS